MVLEPRPSDSPSTASDRGDEDSFQNQANKDGIPTRQAHLFLMQTNSILSQELIKYTLLTAVPRGAHGLLRGQEEPRHTHELELLSRPESGTPAVPAPARPALRLGKTSGSFAR